MFQIRFFYRLKSDGEISKFDEKNNQDVIEYSEELKKKRDEFEMQDRIREIVYSFKITCWEAMGRIIEIKKISKSHFCMLTGLGEEVYRRAVKKSRDSMPTIRTIVAFACGLKLDLEITERLMKLAGRVFSESHEDRLLKFCITGFSNSTIDERNEFLESFGVKPIGTQQRL